jgi:hypothetical protein
LVGTGVLGVTALAIFVLISLRRAFIQASMPQGRIVPLLILMTIVVRSFTGDTFESGGLYCLITLVFVMGLRDKSFVKKGTSTPEEDVYASDPIPLGVG